MNVDTYKQINGDAASSVADNFVGDSFVDKSVLPFVSIVIPCFNEERFIGKVLENTARQYDAARMEIIVVDGMSTDGTRRVVEGLAKSFTARAASGEKVPRVIIVDNPARNIPAALNLGIHAAQGEIIARMDAHAVPSENYVRQCVEVLRSGKAQVVGCPCQIKPGAETTEARAIALAVSHPFGIGDAKYRAVNARTEYVDTVPFGAFKKSLWRDLGGFDEALLANEDYDFYYRARKRGAKILLDTSAHCTYFARPTLADLWTQYARYGRWKAQMLKLHPKSLRVRQAVAPLFVVSLIVCLIGGFFWSPAWTLLVLIVVAYLVCAAIAAMHAARRARRHQHDRHQRYHQRANALIPEMMFAFFLIHIAWGASFLWGLINAPRAVQAKAKEQTQVES